MQSVVGKRGEPVPGRGDAGHEQEENQMKMRRGRWLLDSSAKS